MRKNRNVAKQISSAVFINMDGRPLNHLELLSVAEKDEQYYNEWIGDNLQELAQKCLGIRRWMQFRGAVSFLSRFGYFAMTTLTGITTPGEEFCESQVTSRSFLKELLMIILNNELRMPSEIPKTYLKYVRDIHLITFFLFGDYYELPKRVTNFFYSTSELSSNQSKRMSYLFKFIGCISILQLLLRCSTEAEVGKIDTRPKSIASDNSDSKDSMTCVLCSGRRVEPTSALCGHIFCWDCIHQWLKERSECPICRTPSEPSRLIHLINFK